MLEYIFLCTPTFIIDPVLYVEYENCKRPKEIDDYNREFANMADFRR